MCPRTLSTPSTRSSWSSSRARTDRKALRMIVAHAQVAFLDAIDRGCAKRWPPTMVALRYLTPFLRALSTVDMADPDFARKLVAQLGAAI